MTPQRWRQIKAILEQAIDLPDTQRPSFLLSACSGDLDLRREIDSLLAAHDKADTFIEAPPMPIGAPRQTTTEQSLAGKRFGAYDLVQQIGEGGMSTVYLGVRHDDFVKLVAIKVLKRGMDTNFLLRRFATERQILAHLDHPHIAKIVDSGATPEGRPYFVMEYIAGEPIDEYCAKRNLSTHERLVLFRTVCSAIEYAHQSLVVHRDLKPRNILVTAEGVPKLLDFGIAKILSEEGEGTGGRDATLAGLRLMTPEYASPEQSRGDPVTTSTDVYSLGVLLYELLTGERPYPVKGRPVHEVARMICSVAPVRPSSAATQNPRLQRELTGDIDNILLMALRKDPSRRYASVEQFSSDIERYLDGRPVLAAPDSFSYRASKFLKRHRAGTLAASLGTIALLAAIVGASYQAHVAGQNFADARRLAHALIFEVDDAIRDLQGATPARKLVVDRAIEYLDRLARRAGADTTLRHELAMAYEKVGDVQGYPLGSNLGNSAGALESYRKAMAIRQTLSNPPADLLRERANLHSKLNVLLRNMGLRDEAMSNGRQAIAILEKLATARTGDARARQDLATTYLETADMMIQLGNWKAAREYRAKALPLHESLAAAEPLNDNAQYRLALNLKTLGAAEEMMEDMQPALRHYRLAMAVDEQRSKARPLDAKAKLDLSFDYSQLGGALDQMGDRQGAADYLARCTAVREELYAADRKNARLADRLAFAYSREGRVLLKAARWEEAFARFRQALALRQQQSAADPANQAAQRDVAESWADLGSWHARRGADESLPAVERVVHWRAAQSSYRTALDLCKSLPLEPQDAKLPAGMEQELARAAAALHSLR